MITNGALKHGACQLEVVDESCLQIGISIPVFEFDDLGNVGQRSTGMLAEIMQAEHGRLQSNVVLHVSIEVAFRIGFLRNPQTVEHKDVG